MVEQLESYPWSSYVYYIKKKKAPHWLYTHETYEQLHVKTRMREKYRTYVELGIDEEIAKFMEKKTKVPTWVARVFVIEHINKKIPMNILSQKKRSSYFAPD